MPPVRDPDGGVWSVHRRKWSVRDATETATWGGPDVFGAVIWLLSLPVVLAWLVWRAAKLCGVRWKLTVIRDGVEVATEKVRGKRASDDRVDEIVRNNPAGNGPA